MKYRQIFLSVPLLSIIFCLGAQHVLAHAGVMKAAGDTDVVLYQMPISPLVGEAVEMTFVFTEHDKNDQRRNFPVTLKLIDTFRGDESKDTVLETKSLMTDVNGAITFTYVFPKENFFDIELSYADQNGKEQVIGFDPALQLERNAFRCRDGRAA
jgi:hypothetical protein